MCINHVCVPSVDDGGALRRIQALIVGVFVKHILLVSDLVAIDDFFHLFNRLVRAQQSSIDGL